MLKRLCIDNYKCFVNFEYRPQAVQLLLGSNGAGKSSFFEVLEKVRALVCGGHQAGALFPTKTLTRWQDGGKQRFQFDIDANDGSYSYALELARSQDNERCYVHAETLSFDATPLLSSKDGKVELHRPHTGKQLSFRITQDHSALGIIGEDPENERLIRFRDWFGKVLIVRINPFAITSEAAREDTTPQRDMSNFASWYRHLVQEETPDLRTDLAKDLGAVWEQFKGLRLEKAGENVRVLKVLLASAAGNGSAPIFEQGFDEISDGQRVLIILYTLLHFAKRNPCSLLCIDEPDNFVALREIQPGVLSMRDAAEDLGWQVFLISHHPEVMNLLAPESAVLFKRPSGGPAQVVPFRADLDTTLTPAELVARGELDE